MLLRRCDIVLLAPKIDNVYALLAVTFYPHDDNASDDLRIKLYLIRLDKSERSVFEEMRKQGCAGPKVETVQNWKRVRSFHFCA